MAVLDHDHQIRRTSSGTTEILKCTDLNCSYMETAPAGTLAFRPVK